MMLNFTGEYVLIGRWTPTPTRRQMLASWVCPVRVVVEDHGVDLTRYLTFETTYVLRRGRWLWRLQRSRLIGSEDLREHYQRQLTSGGKERRARKGDEDARW